jgi:hypothetical protein
MREIARGPAAWAPIEADAPGLRVALTCAKCGFAHLIRAGEVGPPGLRLTGMAIGRFGGYDGAWRAPWFELFAPALDRTGSPHWANALRCQSCGETARPRVRRY